MGGSGGGRRRSWRLLLDRRWGGDAEGGLGGLGPRSGGAAAQGALEGSAAAADVGVIEGVMGVHDGVGGATDDGSTAVVAKWLAAPVALLVDAATTARSAAASAHGHVTYDEGVRMAGVVSNRAGGGTTGGG